MRCGGVTLCPECGGVVDEEQSASVAARRSGCIAPTAAWEVADEDEGAAACGLAAFEDA